MKDQICTKKTINENFSGEFKPCIIIPVYNHGALLSESISHILSHKIPLIIVDDGSDQKTQNALVKISRNPGVTICNIGENQGKGAALLLGFQHAYYKKFTHALQIDADNQHSFNDISIFLELAKNNPNSLINGCPIYDETVPKSRLHGRKITNFWVKIETLSCEIADSMCGFRVYPLAPTISLIRSTKISKRMGFDIEIIVKLHRKNVKIINQKTQVTYPKNGTSHFRIFRDNLAISMLHLKLVTTMIIGLPRLIKNKSKTKNHGAKNCNIR